jgi:bilin biosynthesis protein
MGLFDFIHQQKDAPSHPKTIQSLIDDLGQDKPKNVRLEAHDALVEHGYEAVVPLSQALISDDWRVREEAAKILGQIGDEKAVKALIQLFKDEKIRVQLWATDSIISMGTRAVKPLIEALNDDDRRVRMGAVVALGEIQDLEAKEYLRKMLDDDDAEVRAAAIEAIDVIDEKATA